MGNQQSGDTASQSVSTASSEPLPTLLGHTRPTGPDVERAKSKPAEIEVELPDVPDADDAVDCKDIFGPQLFTMSVPFLIVLSVSACCLYQTSGRFHLCLCGLAYELYFWF